jgi:hypothetical protein
VSEIAIRAAAALVTRTMLLAGLAGILPLPAEAQRPRDEQFYYPGRFNWSFLDRYPEAARLFNAFDYGHAILYERLLTRPENVVRRLEEEDYRYLTTDLLVNPPRFAVAEEVIEWRYAKRNWRAKMMFDWAHVLHRQIYDAYADERLTPAARDVLIERLTDYYLSNRKYAFAPVPKSMALMDEQYYSQVFRQSYPKFNGLIWAYHWLQVGLYDPFIEARTPAEKKTNVQATLARFWSMLKAPPRSMPRVMPMTSAIAPKFSAAHPRAAIIFDNLHMTHDIISDILEADTVPAAEKSRVIELALDEMQDSTRNVMSMEMWWNMAEHMGGIAAMGGPATGLLRPPAAADVSPPAGHQMHHHDTPGPTIPRQPADSSGHDRHDASADSAAVGTPPRPGAPSNGP